MCCTAVTSASWPGKGSSGGKEHQGHPRKRAQHGLSNSEIQCSIICSLTHLLNLHLLGAFRVPDIVTFQGTVQSRTLLSGSLCSMGEVRNRQTCLVMYQVDKCYIQKFKLKEFLRETGPRGPFSPTRESGRPCPRSTMLLSIALAS